MFLEQRDELLLEGHSSVVFLLVVNVPTHGLDIRLTHTERAVSRLPSE